MPCEKCGEGGRHHLWCRKCPRWDSDLESDHELDAADIAEGGPEDELPWGPSPTEWMLGEIGGEPTAELPELLAEDLGELVVINDDPIVNDEDNLGEPWGEMNGGIQDGEGRIGYNTPDENHPDFEFGEFSDEMWLSSQKLAEALSQYARESGQNEPPESPMTVPRQVYGEIVTDLPITRMVEDTSCGGDGVAPVKPPTTVTKTSHETMHVVRVNHGASTSASRCECRTCQEANMEVEAGLEEVFAAASQGSNVRTEPIVVHCEPKASRLRLRFEGENVANPRDCTCANCVAMRKREHDQEVQRSLANVIVIDSPASPDEESDPGWFSSSSSDEATPELYAPIVSPITPDTVGNSSQEKRLGASRAQRFWADGFGPMRGRVTLPPRRVATIRPLRPRGRRAEGAFRVTSQAPVIQTRTVLSRVLLRDGSLMEESMHERFVMARTVATQTQLEGRARVPSVMSDEETDRGRDMREYEAESSGTPLQDE
jgi:hypothetical protein